MLFCCVKCNCVDDTDFVYWDAVGIEWMQLTCTECRDRVTYDGVVYPGEWHGAFPKVEYNRYLHRVINRDRNGEPLDDISYDW